MAELIHWVHWLGSAGTGAVLAFYCSCLVVLIIRASIYFPLQHWDGTGGNGSALRHFEQTGKKYPLVVKLGTITPAGADVYSYAEDENDMVEDPLLGEHLAHWGINMLQMEKTEKTMAELQVEKNMEYEFDKITEAGADLKPVSGKGWVPLLGCSLICNI